jgi:hypothetical protein
MKLKRLLSISLTLTFIICFFLYNRNQQNKQIENLNACNSSNIVNLRNGNLSLIFNNDYNKKVQKKINIEIIRHGEILKKIKYFQKKNENQITIEKNVPLLITDSLKITFKDNLSIYIHGFKNEVEYANKKIFLGCFLTYFRIDNQEEMAIRDGSIINIL